MIFLALILIAIVVFFIFVRREPKVDIDENLRRQRKLQALKKARIEKKTETFHL